MSRRKSHTANSKIQAIIGVLLIGVIILGAAYYNQERSRQAADEQYSKPIPAKSDIEMQEAEVIETYTDVLVKSFRRNGYKAADSSNVQIKFIGGGYLTGIWEDDQESTISAYMINVENKWKDVYVGEEPVLCSSIEQYEDFPSYIISECVDQNGLVVNR